MKGFGPLWLGLGVAIALMSCHSALEDARGTVTTTARAINADLVTVRKADEALVAELAFLYQTREALDLSTQGMDDSEGGPYGTFSGNQYYYKTKPGASALYLSPRKPVTDAIRREVKFLEYAEPLLTRAYQASHLTSGIFYGVHTPTTMALMTPWSDVVSALAPGIDLQTFSWYTSALQASGPPRWAPHPVSELSAGWSMEVSAPVVAGGTTHGVTAVGVSLAKLSLQHLHKTPLALILLGPDTMVFGLNPSAKAILSIEVLERLDYLRQIREVTEAPQEYRLNSPSQRTSIQELGRRILRGTAEFSITFEGRSFQVVQRVVEEGQLRVVGLVPQ